MYYNNEDAGDLQSMNAADASEASFLECFGEVLAFILKQEVSTPSLPSQNSPDKYACWEDVREDYVAWDSAGSSWDDNVFEEALNIARL